jgi:hypothetical protein
VVGLTARLPGPRTHGEVRCNLFRCLPRFLEEIEPDLPPLRKNARKKALAA